MATDSKAAQGDWAEQIARTAMGRHAVDVVALDEVASQLRAAEHRGYTMGHKAGDDFRSAALASTAGAGAGGWVTEAQVEKAAQIVWDERAKRSTFRMCSYAEAVERDAEDGANRAEPCRQLAKAILLSAVPASPRSGAGETPTWPASYQETFDAIAAAVTVHDGTTFGISVKAFYRALAYPETASPPAPAEHGVEIREAMAQVIEAARRMPRETPATGGAGTIHRFQIEAGVVWSLDRALTLLDRALSQGGGAGRSERAVEIRELSEKTTQGEWYVESEPCDGVYGSGEDVSEGYLSYSILTDAEKSHGSPGVILESSNSTLGVIHEDHNEDGSIAWDETANRNTAFIVALVNAYRAGQLVHRSEIAGRSEKGEGGGDWRGDPSADERWNDGLDYGMTQFCAVLGVDPQKVTWDAATETVSGDVRAVICNILNAWAGDDWRDRPKEHLSSTAIAALREIKALQGEQKSDKYKKDRAHLIACRALGSLRTAPAQSPSTSDAEG